MSDNNNVQVDVKFLHRFIVDAFLDAVGLTASSKLRLLLRPILWMPTRLFVHLGASFDKRVQRDGFGGACRWVLPRFVDHIDVSGLENIPKEGALIIASNHPGNIDALTLAANLPRKDLKILALDIAFVQGLPNVSKYFIYSTENSNSSERMLAVRAAIRHLQAGGALLIFPAGHVSPDPAVRSGAEEYLGTWSPSLALFLRKAPETKVQLAMLSQITNPRFFNSKIARRRKGVHRQVVAQHMLVAYQLLWPGKMKLTPKLSFAKSIGYAQLQSEGDVTHSIISHAAKLLRKHLT